jgi:chromosome partitioning protein
MTIRFSIFKGGTGKTTSTVSNAAALVKKGKKVLIVDQDQQASATRYLDIDPEQSPSLYEVFTGVEDVSNVLMWYSLQASLKPMTLNAIE